MAGRKARARGPVDDDRLTDGTARTGTPAVRDQASREPETPSRADAVLRLQRTAGNRATVAALQRKPGGPDALVADVRRATGPDGTAAVIWRSADGVIEALVEIDGNPSLDAYLGGRTTIDELVASGRAMWAQQSVGATLPRPAAGPQAAAATPDPWAAGPAPDPWAATASGPVDQAPDGKKKPPENAVAMWSDKLSGLFKKMRTARLLMFLAGRDVMKQAAAAEQQLKLLRRQAAKLSNRLAKSGGGPKVAAQLKAVQAEIAAAEAQVAAGKAAIREANALVRGEAQAATGLFARLKQLFSGGGTARKSASGLIWSRLGKVVGPLLGKLMNVLQKVQGVSKLFATFRAFAPAVTRTLIGLSAALDAVNAYATSKNTTQAGKVADATVTGASGALVVANPVTAIADVLLPKDYKLSTMYRGGSGAVTALGEGLITGDTTAMEGFHEASKRGEYGKVMQVSSEAGDYWAEHGVVGGLKEFGSEFSDWVSDLF